MPDARYKEWLLGEVHRLRKVRDAQAAAYKVNLERVYRTADLKGLPRRVLIPIIQAETLLEALGKLEKLEQGEEDGSEARGSEHREV